MSSHAAVTRLPSTHSGWDTCRLIVDSVIDYAILMLDLDGKVVTWNRGAERIKGYAEEEIIGHHFSRFYPDEDVRAGKPERALAQARDLGRIEDDGWRVRKDGTRFWANVVITALRSSDGTLRGYAKVTRDLTEKRLSEAKLLASEERFHQLVDAVQDYAIFMLDASGHVASWNLGASKIKGYEPSEVIGRHFSLFYTPEDVAANVPAQVLECVRQTGRYEAESWRVRKDGERFWANVVITALKQGGTVVGFAKVTRDLTKKRAAEDELRRSEERFRLLVEGVGDHAIFMLDPQGRVSTWNSGAQRLTGHSSEDILGRHFGVFFPQEDVDQGRPTHELSRALENGRCEVEGWRVRKEGTRFWANSSVTPLYDPRGELLGFAKVTRDLTERRRNEEMRRTLERERSARELAEVVARKAEEANRIQDEFLATVSHELRTPLNAIIGWAKVLRQKDLEPMLAKGLEVIDRNAEAQLRIVEDILDVSRVITGKLRIEPKATDLALIASAAVEMVRPSAAAKDISVSLSGCEQPCLLLGDPDRLQQVVSNLLSNAIKFTPSRGTVQVTLFCGESSVGLAVSDTGRGIEPPFLPHVFDRFKQEDSSTTRRHGGLGLGLALVRHIVELHGGQVKAESSGIGHGARFTITLPARVTSPASTSSSERTSQNPFSGLLNGLRAVVVDDDPDARELLSAVLTGGGASVEIAGSANEGLEAVRRFQPDVLVSDIGMPGEDGFSFIRRVRSLPVEEGGAVPSVALTAYTRDEDRAKALTAGFSMHLSKPISPNELISALLKLRPTHR